MVCTDASLVVRSLGETVTAVESPNDPTGPILIDHFGQVGAQHQIAMSVRARSRAEELASINRIVDDYEEVFETLGVRSQ